MDHIGGIVSSALNQERPLGNKSAYWRGQIVSRDGRMMPCIVWDLQSAGGRIAMESADEIPERFMLWLTKDGQVKRCCEVHRRFDNQASFRFLPSGTMDLSVAAHTVVFV